MPRHKLVVRVRTWLQAMVDTARMQHMDDRLLKDIGIERSEIGRRVRGR